MQRRIFLSAVGTALLWGMGRSARADDLPPKQLALLTLRVLAYDHNLLARTPGKSVPVVVLYNEDDAASDTAQIDLKPALEEAAETLQLIGRPIRISALAFRGGPALEKYILANRPAAIILCPGLADNLPSILVLSRLHKVLTMTSVLPYLKLGASVAIYRTDERTTMAVNVAAMRAEAVAFDAAFLSLAQILR